MNRFLTNSPTSLLTVFIRPKQNVIFFPRLCSFCNAYHSTTNQFFHSIRHVSTTTNTALLKVPTKKRSRKKAKIFAELLEVTNSATSNKKAAITKLGVEQVSLFVNRPDVSLDEIYKSQETKTKKGSVNKKLANRVKNETETVSSSSQEKNVELAHELQNVEETEVLAALEDIINDPDDVALQEAIAAKDPDVNNQLESNSIPDTTTTKSKSKKKTTKEKMARTENEEEHQIQEIFNPTDDQVMNILSTSEKHRTLNRTFLAYLDVCKDSKMVDNVFFFLNKSNTNIHRHKKILIVMMHKYASMGNFQRIREVLDIILNDQIHVTPPIFAPALECIGRLSNEMDFKEHLEYIQREMLNHRITLNQVIDRSIFVNDQQRQVLKAIKFLQPNFKPLYTEPSVHYSNQLLKNITCTSNARISPSQGLFSRKELSKLIKAQLDNEIKGSISIQNIDSITKTDAYTKDCRVRLKRLENHWRKVAMEMFKKNLHTLEKLESFNIHAKIADMHPYLSVLEPEVYVDALMQEVRKLAVGSYTYSPSLSYLCRQLGMHIYRKYEIQTKLNNNLVKKVGKIHEDYCDWYLNRSDGSNNRVKWSMLVHKDKGKSSSMETMIPVWPSSTLCNVGRFLYNIILEDLKIDNSFVNVRNKNPLPAFYTVYRTKPLEMKQEVKPHISVMELYRDSKQQLLTFDASLVPSLCPPRPWESVNNGGYLITKVDVVRMPIDSIQILDRLLETKSKQLYPVFDSINQLGSIPWKINTPILDIAIKIFREGGMSELDIPETPSKLPPAIPINKSAEPKERFRIFTERVERLKKKNEMYSLWCDGLYKLSLANHYRDKVFWLPHNMDFRGRVYPVPPHLTHVSSDLARSLLVFAKGKPLGPKGLDWLKIHTINLTGIKKRDSIQARLEYANEIMDDIVDSAENPLTGKMWWSKSDEPWQTLAACMELVKAMRHPNPQEYVSSFPIHQDGSCNGLQHYAALGRDVIGAESVNLLPRDVPQDVYRRVADMVEKIRAEDAKNDVKIAQLLEGHVNRKVVKQTVMTTVYGVTKYGAKLQIIKQLKEIEDIPKKSIWLAGSYLSNKTFESLQSMFTSTKEIQNWLTECARLVAQVRQQSMEWVTPLGFPIVQPYMKRYRVKADNNNTTSKEAIEIVTSRRANVSKQKNAFPPNFIHSLDSSHMMLTSLHCQSAGITFVSVHDCFWTHCCDVEQMSKICREQFVALHSQPILEDLSQFLLKRFKYPENELKATQSKISLGEKTLLNQTLASVPEKGCLDLREILSSPYFFS